MTAALLLAACLAAPPAPAQVGFGAGIGPDTYLQSEGPKKVESPMMPVALATSLAFDATTWAAVQVSTNPAGDLSALVKRGYGKLELVESVLLAVRAKTSLKEITTPHDKGKTLRELAQLKSVDFDALYEEALRVDHRITDELLPSIMSVQGAPAEQADAAPPRPRRRAPPPRRP